MSLLPSIVFAVTLAGCKGGADDTASDSGAAVVLEPGEFQVGIATTRIPAPLGIGVVGNGPDPDISSDSPFAEIYPATTTIHGHPEFKVVALSRGEGFELIMVRVDAVGFFQQLRRAVVLELQERTGRDYDQALVFGATHTHSGPGRIIDAGGLFDIIADRYFPEFYALFVDTLADVVQAALADLQPARLGTVVGVCDDGHNDRRCQDDTTEDGYQNGELPLIFIEREGQVDAVLTAYAIHGTVFGLSDLVFSQDVSGAIEQAVEDRFDHPVQVLMFNSWGADMSPGNPTVETQEGVAGRPDGFDRVEQVGAAVADSVLAQVDNITWEDTPQLRSTVVRVAIDRDAIGYDDETFLYDYGAVYCQGGNDCEDLSSDPELDVGCLPFNEDYPAPNQTVLGAGTMGPFTLITFPGEPGTLLAEQLISQVRSAYSEVGDVFFMGYGQDYIGYSLLEDDWWYGGYESSGSLWGPLQGEYLLSRSVETVGQHLGYGQVSDQPDPITPFDDPVFDPYQAEEALAPGTVEVDVAATYGRTDTVSFTFWGSDPWLGPPQVTLETSAGTPVLRPNGSPVNSNDYEFHLQLATDPTYEEDIGPATRTFLWTAHLPVQRTTVGWFALDAGEYVLRASVPTSATESVEVLSSSFSVVD